jgi:peptidoglycan/LPS O-acetylase OafA/YrhL
MIGMVQPAISTGQQEMTTDTTTGTDGRLTYRPYLDGLRAVAVLLVYVFHAVPSALPGGFIGVDVFFVLSGYLITRLLVEERESSGSIALRRFYARRSRRLAPAAALLVLIVSLREAVWGSVLTAAGRTREAIATLFYVANWNLITVADDYFAEGDASPLRHAWSLAVEEQFYLVWPVVMVVVMALVARRRQDRRALLIVTLVLAAASFSAMAMLFDPTRVARTYYGSDARIFQPLLGAAAGIVMAGRPRSAVGGATRWGIVAAAAMTVLVVGSMVMDGGSAMYHRGGALVVAVTAVVLVVALEHAHGGAVARVLSLRPVVGLGVISYGFYLWHWPILLWVQGPDNATFAERRLVNVLQLALTLAVAVASHRLVEDPVRRRAVWPLARLHPIGTVAAGVALLTVTAVASVALLRPPDVEAAPALAEPTSAPAVGEAAVDPATLSRQEREMLALQALDDPSVRGCPDNPLPCLRVDGGPGAPVVAIVGDSTAQHYDPGMRLLAAEYGFTYVQAAAGGCPIGRLLLATGLAGERHKSSNLACFEHHDAIYEQLFDIWAPTLVIATSYNDMSNHMQDDVVVASGGPEHLAGVEAAVREAIEGFVARGATVVLLDVLPRGASVECLDKDQPDAGDCVMPRRADGRDVAHNEMYRRLAAEIDGVISLSLTDEVCEPDRCPLMRSGLVMRYDGGHFTGAASRRLAPALEERLRAAGVDLGELRPASAPAD